MTKIYAVINRKGGQGKTTVATNVAQRIAHYLEPEDKRVLVIDLDPQGHAARALGVQANGRCIGDFLLGNTGIQEVMVSADRAESSGPRRRNLFVIPASDQLKHSRSQLQIIDYMNSRNKKYKGPLLDSILSYRFSPYVKHFEYIFIDCPPSLDVLDTAVYDFAQHVIVPIKMAFLDSDGARQQLENVLEAQQDGHNITIRHVVPTFFRANEILARQVLKQLAGLYRKQLAYPIPQSVIVEQAQASGQQTLFEFAPDSKPAQAMERLVKQVMS